MVGEWPSAAQEESHWRPAVAAAGSRDSSVPSWGLRPACDICDGGRGDEDSLELPPESWPRPVVVPACHSSCYLYVPVSYERLKGHPHVLLTSYLLRKTEFQEWRSDDSLAKFAERRLGVLVERWNRAHFLLCYKASQALTMRSLWLVFLVLLGFLVIQD